MCAGVRGKRPAAQLRLGAWPGRSRGAPGLPILETWDNEPATERHPVELRVDWRRLRLYRLSRGGGAGWGGFAGDVRLGLAFEEGAIDDSAQQSAQQGRNPK